MTPPCIETAGKKYSHGPASSLTSQYIFGALFCFFALFPWVNFGLLKTDTQPWYALIAIIYLLTSRRLHVPKGSLIVLLLPFFALLSIAFSNFESLDFILRGFFSYVFFAVGFWAFYNLRLRYGFPWRIFVVSNVIWILASLMQLYFGPYIFEDFIVTRGSPSRGVSSLSSEPTFFAIFLFFISWIYLVECGYRPQGWIRILIILNIIFILFVAKSSMGFLFLVLATVFFMFAANPFKAGKWAIVFIFLGMICIFLIDLFIPESRLNILISKLDDGIFPMLQSDASINARVGHILISLYASAVNVGLPGSFDTFDDISIMYNNTVFDGFFFYSIGSGRIMSYLGAIFYEIGFFVGLLFLFFVINTSGVLSRIQIIQGVSLLVFLLAAIPINFPLVSVILVSFQIKKRTGSARRQI